jgi:predicted HTH domain antitoxin
MTRTICMEVDEELLLGMNKSPEELAGEMRLAAAVKWYEMGMISQETAARLSGMGRAAFIDALSRFGVSPFQETAEEILDALNESGV